MKASRFSKPTRRGFLISSFGAVLASSGCSKAPNDAGARLREASGEPLVATRPPPGRPPTLHANPMGGICRLTQDLWRVFSKREAREEPLPLESWRPSPGVSAGRDDAGGLVLRNALAKPVAARREVDIGANEFNILRVRMRVSAGEKARVRWTSDLEPDLERNPGVAQTVFPSDEAVTYVFRLDPLAAPRWEGRISMLEIIPSEAPGEAVVESVELVYEPGKGPQRLTLQGDTREALHGRAPEWVVEVPPRAFLEAWCGIAPVKDSPPALFTIAVERDGEAEALGSLWVQPGAGWKRLTADLTPYAAESVTLRFMTHTDPGHRESYAYWGNPMVCSRPANRKPTPVFLISCDTLRADHLSCYGYPRETTPHLDAFAAQDAVLFENAVAQDTRTLTSHMTMLTGLHTKNHKLTAATNLSEDIGTLPERLREAGYLTQGRTGHAWWLLASRGYAKGFDEYSVPNYPSHHSFRDVFRTHEQALAWLDNQGSNQVFLFLHNYDIHSRLGGVTAEPYFPADERFLHFAKQFDPPPDFGGEIGSQILEAANDGELMLSQTQLDYMVALYDDSIRAVDYALAEFFAELKERGLYEDSLIIVTSDHGEEFGEHGKFLHNQGYAHTSHVPLIVKLPRGEGKGKRVEDVVQHVDLLPTVLDLLGWAAGEACDGQSLLPAIRSGADVGREAFTDSPAHGHFAMRSGRYSLHGLHERDVTEMFDLVRDPQELNNLLATEPPPQYEPLADVFRSFFRPPAAGWRLRVQAPADSDVTLNFSARGRGPLAGAYVRRWGWTGPLYTYQPGSSVASAVFDVRRRQDMTVQVAPTDRTQTLEVSLKSETPFRVAFGGQTAAPRRTFSSVLVPEMAGRTLPQVEPRAHDKDLPLILIWYVPPENLGEQAEELPPEAVEELQGLGYL